MADGLQLLFFFQACRAEKGRVLFPSCVILLVRSDVLSFVCSLVLYLVVFVVCSFARSSFIPSFFHSCVVLLVMDLLRPLVCCFCVMFHISFCRYVCLT